MLPWRCSLPRYADGFGAGGKQCLSKTCYLGDIVYQGEKQCLSKTCCLVYVVYQDVVYQGMQMELVQQFIRLFLPGSNTEPRSRFARGDTRASKPSRFWHTVPKAPMTTGI
eukprot:14259920-Ditylum_brightwellii.AAC.1